MHPEDSSKFLLLVRKKDDVSRPGDYDLPGGNVSPNELHDQALLREIKEETNLNVTELKPIQVSSYFNEEKKNYFLFIGYMANAKNSNVVTNLEEHDGYRWVTLAEFEKEVGNHILRKHIRLAFPYNYQEGDHLQAKIGQYGLIKDKEGKVLILERARSKTWTLPGGRLNRGEGDKAALIREIKEETGLDCRIIQPVDTAVITDPFQTKYCVFFELEIKSAIKVVLNSEHSSFKWIDMVDFENINFEDEKIADIVKRFMGRL